MNAGIYDEKMLRESSWSTAVNLYAVVKPFIDEARRIYSRPTMWQEFEWLACRWKDKPLQKKTIKALTH